MGIELHVTSRVGCCALLTLGRQLLLTEQLLHRQSEFLRHDTEGLPDELDALAWILRYVSVNLLREQLEFLGCPFCPFLRSAGFYLSGLGPPLLRDVMPSRRHLKPPG